MRTRFLHTGLLATALLGTSCSDGLVEDGLAQVQNPLYYDSTHLWTDKAIPVCWTSTGSDTEKAWVRDAITNSWARYSALTFPGWGDCASGQAGIQLTPSTTNVTFSLGNQNGR